jgi:hypothetical protein
MHSCTAHHAHAEQILANPNEVIANSTVLRDYRTRVTARRRSTATAPLARCDR